MPSPPQLPLLPEVSPAKSSEPATPTILEGTLERIVFANPENAWSVVRLKVPGEPELVTAVGNLLAVQPGVALRLSGAWERDARFGRQFRVSSYQTVTPSTLVGIERYLGSGLVRGIGKKLAQRLVRRFGLKTLKVIEESPERIAEVRGIGKRRSGEIQRAFREQHGIQELMVFLQAHGVATGLAVKIHKRYGEAAMAVVRETPFRLAAEVAGIGFTSADRIAGAFGLPKDAPQRLEAALLHLLDDAAGRGHLFLPRRALLDGAVTLLGVDRARLEEAAAALAARGEVVVEPFGDGEEAVYLPPLHAAETEIAERLVALTRAAPRPLDLDVERALAWLEKRERIALAPEQREAIRLGLTRKVLVVTGGPGTGKTTLVRGIVAVLERKQQRVLLAAPTGRAAKRLAEATGREASTLHRLLEWDARTHAFARSRERPLECDLLIVDEASMLDAPLAAQVLRAVPDRARLVLVGDVDQLPSVGPGRVLADLIRSGAVEVVRLTTIFRQAERSLIVTNAHRVQRGEMPLLLPPAGDGADFFFLERERPEEVLDTLCELVAHRIPQRFGFHPVEEVQVLTPMNRGLLGTASLNGVLRELLNPAGAGALPAGNRRPVGSTGTGRLAQPGLRVGDKVMQVRNNYDLEVFNGDLGRVVKVDAEEERVEVAFDGRRVAYEAAALDELVLAYACSIHKSQGSEYPCVVVPLHSQHYVMLQRNLLYTALTRARRLAILVGEKRALRVAVGNARTRERHTLLAERLASLRSS